MSELLWYISRATGVVSLLLLTGVLVLGVASTSLQSSRRTTVSAGLHRTLGLGLVVFLLAHVVTAIVDAYVDLGWLSALVPFASGYQKLWVGLGSIALDLLLAVTVTSVFRHRLPEPLWRAVHYSSWVLWLCALAHGFAMGTSDQPVLRGLTVCCGIAGLAAAGYSTWHSTRDANRRRLIAAQEWR